MTKFVPKMDLEWLFKLVDRQRFPASSDEEIIHLAGENINRTFLDHSTEQDPDPMDTIGNLVDKLCIVNNKMFFNQQWLYETRHESIEAFETKWAGKMPELHAMLKRCLDLNNQRSKLMDEIDKKMHGYLTGKDDPEDMLRPQHKTY